MSCTSPTSTADEAVGVRTEPNKDLGSCPNAVEKTHAACSARLPKLVKHGDASGDGDDDDGDDDDDDGDDKCNVAGEEEDDIEIVFGAAFH